MEAPYTQWRAPCPISLVLGRQRGLQGSILRAPLHRHSVFERRNQFPGSRSCHPVPGPPAPARCPHQSLFFYSCLEACTLRNEVWIGIFRLRASNGFPQCSEKPRPSEGPRGPARWGPISSQTPALLATPISEPCTGKLFPQSPMLLLCP